jgi:hypothetical protein
MGPSLKTLGAFGLASASLRTGRPVAAVCEKLVLIAESYSRCAHGYLSMAQAL